MTNEIIDRHHLLEIILWPNGDGTFTEIRNSAERLQELGIYDDFKLTIPLTRSEHSRLHNSGKPKSEEHRRNISAAKKGKTSNRKGVTLSEETKKKISESHKGKPAHNKGMSPSAETRAKLSESKKAYYARRKLEGGI